MLIDATLKAQNGICLKTSNTHKLDVIVKWLETRGIEIIRTSFMREYIVLKCYTKPFAALTSTSKIRNCYECKSVYEFILKARAMLAREWGQNFKINARCGINNLPTIIKEMACVNLTQFNLASGTRYAPNGSTVNEFVWNDTQEGWKFWHDIYAGILPVNFNEKRLLFDIEQYFIDCDDD